MKTFKTITFSFAIVFSFKILGVENFKDPSIDMKQLRSAWFQLTHRKVLRSPKSTYSIMINGSIFYGGTPWESRWNMIDNALDWDNLSVLDLKSDVGLTVSFLKKYKTIKRGVCVESPQNIQETRKQPTLIQAMNMFQSAFGAFYDIALLDLNKTAYESALGSEFDVVFAFDLLKYIDDKERLMSYLSSFPIAFFELPRESSKSIIDRLLSLGFDYYINLGESSASCFYLFYKHSHYHLVTNHIVDVFSGASRETFPIPIADEAPSYSEIENEPLPEPEEPTSEDTQENNENNDVHIMPYPYPMPPESVPNTKENETGDDEIFYEPTDM